MGIKVRQKTKAQAPSPPSPPLKKDRDLPKFKVKRNWVVILEYRDGLRKEGLRYQRLGFKVEGGIKAAFEEAQKHAKSLGKALGNTLKEIQGMTLCRVVGLYAEHAYKDWEKEAGKTLSTNSANKHTRDTVNIFKNLPEDKPKSKVKALTTKVKVR